MGGSSLLLTYVKLQTVRRSGRGLVRNPFVNPTQ